MDREFRVGGVFAESLTVLFSNIVPFVIISAIVHIPIVVYALVFVSRLENMTPAEARQAYETYSLAVIGLSIILTPISTGAITYGVIQQARGKRASIGECVSVGISRLLPVLAVAIAAGLLTVLGFVLLIIPGLIIMCQLYVAVPAAVVEQCGTSGALRRSQELTSGFRWHILGVAFLLGIIDQFLTRIVDKGLSLSPTSATVDMLIMLFLGMVTGAWQATASAVAYYRLRDVKESVDIDELASVFD